VVSLIVTTLVFASSAFDDEAEALAKARAFRQVAATANGTYLNHYEPAFELRDSEHDSNQYVFNFKDGRVRLRRSDHLIIGFSFSPADANWPPPDTWDSQNAVGDVAAQALAEQYIAASGWSQLCVLKSLLRGVAGGDMAYIMSYAPQYNNVNFHPHDKISLTIEYHSGRLLMLARTIELPNPPASLTPSITLESALYYFLVHLSSEYGVTHINLDAADLVIWNPKPWEINTESNTLPQSVLGMIGTNESTLVYCLAASQPSTGQTVKADIAAFGGYVDPQSGTVWSVKRYSPFGRGGRPGLLRWDLGVGAITVSNGKQAIEVKEADVDQVFAPRTFTPSSKIVLRRAKVVVVIEYDRTSGLIRTSQNEMHSYGKPSDNLKRALDQLTR